MKLEKIIPLSGGKHIKLSVSRGNARFNFVKFSTTPDEFPYQEGCDLDFAVSLDISIYQQKEYLSFNIKDIRPSHFDTEKAMLEIQLYDQYKKGIIRPELADKYPSRDDFALIYRYIKKAINSEGIGAFKLLIVFDIMQELRLVSYERIGDDITVSLNDTPKVDLLSSSIYKRLKEDINNV